MEQVLLKQIQIFPRGRLVPSEVKVRTNENLAAAQEQRFSQLHKGLAPVVLDLGVVILQVEEVQVALVGHRADHDARKHENVGVVGEERGVVGLAGH